MLGVDRLRSPRRSRVDYVQQPFRRSVRGGQPLAGRWPTGRGTGPQVRPWGLGRPPRPTPWRLLSLNRRGRPQAERQRRAKEARRLCLAWQRAGVAPHPRAAAAQDKAHPQDERARSGDARHAPGACCPDVCGRAPASLPRLLHAAAVPPPAVERDTGRRPHWGGGGLCADGRWGGVGGGGGPRAAGPPPVTPRWPPPATDAAARVGPLPHSTVNGGVKGVSPRRRPRPPPAPQPRRRAVGCLPARPQAHASLPRPCGPVCTSCSPATPCTPCPPPPPRRNPSPPKEMSERAAAYPTLALSPTPPPPSSATTSTRPPPLPARARARPLAPPRTVRGDGPASAATTPQRGAAPPHPSPPPRLAAGTPPRQ